MKIGDATKRVIIQNYFELLLKKLGRENLIYSFDADVLHICDLETNQCYTCVLDPATFDSESEAVGMLNLRFLDILHSILKFTQSTSQRALLEKCWVLNCD